MSTLNTPEEEKQSSNRKSSNNRRWIWRAGAVVVVLCIGIVFFTGRAETRIDSATYKVNRGDLRITVVEGGSIEAQESQEIRSEVQGQARIISIVEEGYRVTREDIENGMVLVELDSSDLQERLTQQEITYLSSLASLTDSREQYGIQISQNESDVRDAELSVKFARMDIQKYLGAEVAVGVLNILAIDEEALFAEVTLDDMDGEALEDLSDDYDANKSIVPKVTIDTAPLIQDSRLGGEAQQTVRKLQSDITLAQEELKQAETRHEWTQRLFEQGFVTASEEEQDRMTVQRREILLQQAMTSEDLFIQYEFPKQIETYVSNYEQAIRKLERVRRTALSKLAQADSKLKSSEATYNLQRQRLNEYKEQLEKCIIRAEREGIVVYAGGTDPFRNQDPIEEGTMVRERQEILTIPDMNRMAVRVQVHESSINRVRRGQLAMVRADAFAEEIMRGEVARVAMLPDSSRRWMNPDISVFATTVSIDGMHDWLKPGMSAQAEIIIAEYKDVIYVPIQAVTLFNGQRVCYVVQGGRPVPREIEIGDYNDRYMHVLAGLNEGDEVMLRPPRPEGQSVPREETDPLLMTPGEGQELPMARQAEDTQGASPPDMAQRPEGMEGAPGAGIQRPAGMEGAPGTGGQRPAGMEGAPGTGGQRPEGMEGAPGAGRQRPAGVEGTPGAGGQRPAGAGTGAGSPNSNRPGEAS